MRALPSGTDVTLTVVRDGKAIEVDVTLAVRPESSQQGQQQEPQQQAPDQQGGGSGTNPENMTPDELWEWFQQQQGQG